MNIVIPVAISSMHDGSRTLCLSSLKSKNGGMARLSMITKTDNEIADVMNYSDLAGFRNLRQSV